MQFVTNIPAYAKVIATSVVTWAMAIALFIQALVAYMGDEDWIPEGWITIAGRIVVILLGLVAAIRAVTPVSSDERGLLPPS